jgi:hypothetical protein
LGEAWGNKTTPNVSGVGVAYMLRGDKGVSNTDPFATGPTATNQWIVSPPHLMIVFENLQMLEDYPIDPAKRRPLGDVEGYTLRPPHGSRNGKEDAGHFKSVEQSQVGPLLCSKSVGRS